MTFTATQPLSPEEWNRRIESGWFEKQSQTIAIWTTMKQIRVAMRSLDIKIQNGLPSRKLMADEMDEIRPLDIRADVEIHQQAISLMVNGQPLWLELSWHEQTTGLFGPVSSREALARRSLSMDEMGEVHLAEALGEKPIPPERNADRGGSAWRLGLVCPKCRRPRCTVLRSAPGENDWSCVKCFNPGRLSSRWPHHSGDTARGRNERLYRQHSEAAARLAVRHLKAKNIRGGGMQAPAHLLYQPNGMSNKRFMAICKLIDAHRVIADCAYMQQTIAVVDAILPGCMGESAESWAKDMKTAIAHARLDLDNYKWVLKQSNHWRRGKPSDSPNPHARAKAAAALERTLHTQGDVAKMTA